ncbi:hypothetical protein WJX81_005047 [Elliptochloris bilobata]|uniref:Uncharacterized protein n=1 Tax=Elliptochloris bilobata TaxID=381761 RepID=A0AAW1R2E1_9CHLO
MDALWEPRELYYVAAKTLGLSAAARLAFAEAVSREAAPVVLASIEHAWKNRGNAAGSEGCLWGYSTDFMLKVALDCVNSGQSTGGRHEELAQAVHVLNMRTYATTSKLLQHMSKGTTS